MKKFLSELKWNDRTKLALSALATGVVLVFSILFPLAFRTHGEPEEETAPLRLEERAALFARYWSGEEDTAAETLEIPDTQMTVDCAAVMQRIAERCIADLRLNDAAPSGSEYIRISDGESGLTAAHMWLEKTGDWKNWLDVYFDAETGEIYYLYLSCGNVANLTEYHAAEDYGCGQIAAELAAQLGGVLRYADEEQNGSQTLVFSAEAGSICYSVKCVAYDNLVDVKINCF